MGARTGFSKWALQWLVAACVGLLAVTASAGSLSPKDRKQIIEVVQGQLDAFAHGNAAKAFSYAAPNIRHLMGNADNFMNMVRTHYEVVYRPASTTFMQPAGEAKDAELKVQMTDEAGHAWVASYTLQRQKDKAWRITGCTVVEATGTMV